MAIEAFSIAFKAGNAMILRGGKESRRTVAVLYGAHRRLQGGGPARGVRLGHGSKPRAREVAARAGWRHRCGDPRGEAGLLAAATNSSRIPVIKNDLGMCHISVAEPADLHMAAKVAVNAKCSRPGVCNATETVLVHKAVAPELLPQLYDQMRARGVQIRGCPATLKILGKRQGLVAAKPKDWDTEHLDLILNLRVVKSMTEALAHIATHGSRHSEAIITGVEATARRFQTEVDADAVYWNASTSFTDGFEFGLGGEVGISMTPPGAPWGCGSSRAAAGWRMARGRRGRLLTMPSEPQVLAKNMKRQNPGAMLGIARVSLPKMHLVESRDVCSFPEIT